MKDAITLRWSTGRTEGEEEHWLDLDADEVIEVKLLPIRITIHPEADVSGVTFRIPRREK